MEKNDGDDYVNSVIYHMQVEMVEIGAYYDLEMDHITYIVSTMQVDEVQLNIVIHTKVDRDEVEIEVVTILDIIQHLAVPIDNTKDVEIKVEEMLDVNDNLYVVNLVEIIGDYQIVLNYQQDLNDLEELFENKVKVRIVDYH